MLVAADAVAADESGRTLVDVDGRGAAGRTAGGRGDDGPATGACADVLGPLTVALVDVEAGSELFFFVTLLAEVPLPDAFVLAEPPFLVSRSSILISRRLESDRGRWSRR